MKENIIYVSLRLNMDIPQHVEINQVLQKLNKKVYKSKNQFMVEAIEFYVKNYGREAFMEVEDKDSGFVTKDEMKQREKELHESVMKEAREEIMRSLGGMMAGMQLVAGVMPKMQAANPAPAKEQTVQEDSPKIVADDYMQSLFDGM